MQSWRGGSGQWVDLRGFLFCRFAVAILLGFISIRSPSQLSQRARSSSDAFCLRLFGRETGDKVVGKDLIFIMREGAIYYLLIGCHLIDI